MHEDPLHLPPSALPAVHARARRAVARLTADPLATACPHVGPLTADDHAAVLCAEHPAAGLMCGSCSTEHTRRHPWAVEHRCDECGATARTMRGCIGRHNVAAMVRTTAGRVSVYLGPVHVVALGTCVPCAQAAGAPTPGVVER